MCGLKNHGVWIWAPTFPHTSKDPLLHTYCLSFLLSYHGCSIYHITPFTYPCIRLQPPSLLYAPLHRSLLCRYVPLIAFLACLGWNWKGAYPAGWVGLRGSSLRPIFPPFWRGAGPYPGCSRYLPISLFLVSHASTSSRAGTASASRSGV